MNIAHQKLNQRIQHKINTKTKPIGALGRLEELALQICCVQQTESPQLKAPHILVFAADHGIANEGVSAYPQEVTWQMVLNFLSGGAAINVLANQHHIQVKIIDAGVNKKFEPIHNLINAKVGYSTANFLHQAAITTQQLSECKAHAIRIVDEVVTTTGCTIMGFGEMGIGNTSAAAMLMHCLTNIPLSNCIGAGTGINNEQLQKKQSILHAALAAHTIDKNDPYAVLATFGGFEIAMLTEAMLQAHAHNCILMIDGFIATAAYLVAVKINSAIASNAIFCHQSHEKGHQLLLNYLQVTPLINLNMRLGEGSGCAVAYPIIASAVNFINNMASFETAGVTDIKH